MVSESVSSSSCRCSNCFFEHAYLLLMSFFHPNHLASDVSGGCVNAVVFALGSSIFFQLVGAGMCVHCGASFIDFLIWLVLCLWSSSCRFFCLVDV